MIPKGTIISGFAGIGKTQASKRFQNSIDLESSDYLFRTPNHLKHLDVETMKGSPLREPVPDGMDNYIKAIKQAQSKYDYVFIAMYPEFLQRLKDEHIDVQIIMPSLSQKNHYKERYLNRGNRPSWIQRRMNDWNLSASLDNLKIQFSQPPIILDENQYLSDLLLP